MNAILSAGPSKLGTFQTAVSGLQSRHRSILQSLQSVLQVSEEYNEVLGLVLRQSQPWHRTEQPSLCHSWCHSTSQVGQPKDEGLGSDRRGFGAALALVAKKMLQAARTTRR